MKKILFSLMAVVLCLGLMGGAFAYFSDTETSSGNTFTAGTLDLKVDGGDVIGTETLGPMVASEWVKWDEHVLLNAGTIPGELCIHLTIAEESGGDNPEPEQEVEGGTMNNADLAAYLDVIIVYCVSENLLHVVEVAATWEEACDLLIAAGYGANIKAAGKLLDVACTQWELDDVMEPEEFSRLQILVHMEDADNPETPGVNECNKLQGDYVVVDKVIKLLQIE